MTIEFTDGDPGHGPCSRCGKVGELRMGVCFDCAAAEEDGLEIQSRERLIDAAVREGDIALDVPIRADRLTPIRS